jgi:hypothetical protein
MEAGREECCGKVKVNVEMVLVVSVRPRNQAAVPAQLEGKEPSRQLRWWARRVARAFYQIYDEAGSDEGGEIKQQVRQRSEHKRRDDERTRRSRPTVLGP